MSAVDLALLGNQFRGRKIAELILKHVKGGNRQCVLALIHEKERLPAQLSEGVADLLDEANAASMRDPRKFFADDLGNKLPELVDLARDFFRRRNGFELTEDQAFACFQIIILNFAYGCFKSPSTKAAMQKAAGIGFLRRLMS